MRVVEGPLVNLHDTRVGDLGHRGAARSLSDVWRAVRTNVRFVLEGVTLADVVAGKLPPEIETLASSYRAEPDRAPQTLRDS